MLLLEAFPWANGLSLTWSCLGILAAWSRGEGFTAFRNMHSDVVGITDDGGGLHEKIVA
jgi:hypothetical protein